MPAFVEGNFAARARSWAPKTLSACARSAFAFFAPLGGVKAANDLPSMDSFTPQALKSALTFVAVVLFEFALASATFPALAASAFAARSLARYCAFESGVPALAVAAQVAARITTRASPASGLATLERR